MIISPMCLGKVKPKPGLKEILSGYPSGKLPELHLQRQHILTASQLRIVNMAMVDSEPTIPFKRYSMKSVT